LRRSQGLAECVLGGQVQQEGTAGRGNGRERSTGEVRADGGGLQVRREPPAAFRMGRGEKRRADRADEGGLQARRKPPAAGRSEEVMRSDEGAAVDRDHIGSDIPKVRWDR
jgi:hypothetical protein